MDFDPSVGIAPVTRRSLLVAGAGLGLSAVARPAVEERETIAPEDVANALNGCLGVSDFTLLLRIKPSLRDVRERAQPLLAKLSPLAEKTRALADQVRARSFPPETNALA